MIYLRLAGGLGNQLFQLAAAALLGKNTGQPIMALTDALSSYAQVRAPDALRLVSCQRMVADEHASLKPVLRWLIVNGRAGRWMPIFGVNDRSTLRETTRAVRRWGGIMDGYFQRGWTSATFSEATSEFTPCKQSERSNSAAPDVCLIHVRGNDFLLHHSHRVVEANYYVRAIQNARAVGWGRFAIMTDDPDYARDIAHAIERQISNVDIALLSPAPDPLDDFSALRDAPARIIGNSTFAWWAAALDIRHALTWSPSKFARGLPRDFHLDWERAIAV
jgi:hypothetical protein